MPTIPDLSDPRFLDEIGWFLYHEKYGRDRFGGSYESERLANSRLLLAEVVQYLGADIPWIEGKTVVSIGSGCTGDLAAFPAAVKLAIDPLLYTYQKLGMLMRDEAGSPTVYLSTGAENLPLLDDFADLVISRNALDHMPDPAAGLKEMWRILKKAGALFVSVDLGGVPTPDEPTVFSKESLCGLLGAYFDIAVLTDDHAPHSVGRTRSCRVLAMKNQRAGHPLDKEEILRAYESHLPRFRSVSGK
ncbi:MAG TPA: methyltransferase domain-containing protein [Candidatus Eisenbacteria bacterium]|nr:methyltransferase domain-containing protein [Candidatus Eisenbacteria bacterium]